MDKSLARRRGWPQAGANDRLHMGRWVAKVVAVTVSISVLGPQQSIWAQENDGVCDPDLLRNARGRQGYRKIDEQRCEGLYASNVSGTVLWIAALTEAFEYDPSNDQPLALRWNAPVEGPLRIRAQSVKRDLYYRMDASSGASHYQWETSILRGHGVRANDIGLLAWRPAAPGSQQHELLVPLSVSQGPEVQHRGAYDLVIVPNIRLREVYYTVARADSVGQRPTDDFLVRQEPLRRRLYAAQRPITIPIADLGAPGIIFVEISAERTDGRPVAINPIWFYHNGT